MKARDEDENENAKSVAACASHSFRIALGGPTILYICIFIKNTNIVFNFFLIMDIHGFQEREEIESF